MRVLLAGGGTAGHTSPLLATAEALRRREPGVDITCVGTERGLETRLVPAAGFRLELIPPVPIPRSLSLTALRTPTAVVAAVRAAGEVLRRVGPDVVVGFGGYVAGPVYLAARRAGVPLVIHEGNAVPGLANRLGARFADVVATSFPDTPLNGAHWVGLPVRRAISTLDRAAERVSARSELGLAADLTTLLVTGGSQGARRLNETVPSAAADLAAAGVQVLHVAGPRGSARPPDDCGPDAPPYIVVSFVDAMERAYAAADAVVCRAGASSVTEAAVLGLPAVFVPLPIGNGEQALNAAAVVRAGGALLVDDRDFDPAWVRRELVPLLVDRERLCTMGRAARDLVRPHADEALADLVLSAARR
ncbi:MAG: undecaprenyldiphospho-muramoylpentapeptide beta-N-acetylglucosaminyltransferase [Nocardioidaceae bacterium]